MILLKEIDKKIIKTLENKKTNVTDLAIKTGLNRTTIQYRIKFLLKNKIILKSNIVGKKILYSLNKTVLNEIHKSKTIEIFSKKNIIQAYKYFFMIPKHTIIYSVQGIDAIDKILKIIPSDFLKEAHHIQKRRNIIIKGITNKGILTRLKDIDKNILNSHIGRAVGLKLIDSNFFTSSCEVLSCKSALLITNTKKEYSIILKDKIVSNFFYEILSFFYDNFEENNVFKLNDFFEKIVNEKKL